MQHLTYTALAIDLGGVLLKYSVVDSNGLSHRQIKNAIDSPAWHSYERGQITREECYSAVTKSFGFEATKWEYVLKQMIDQLKPNSDLVTTIRELKSANPKLKVYCLSNISDPDFQHVKSKVISWGIFDGFHLSTEVKHRKPEFEYYRAFMNAFHEEAECCIFMDDCLENIVAARSLGFQTILFKDTQCSITALRNLLGDPVARGMAYLRRHAKQHYSVTNTGAIQPDNYSQLLILQNTGERELVVIEKKGHTWNYFIGDPVVVNTIYPDDSDTTSLAMAVLQDIAKEEKDAAIEAILNHLSPDGLPYCWLDKSRPRFCHCICANVFRFFYLEGEGKRLPSVYAFLCRILRSQAYLLGTRYYEVPDWFLYFLTDVCSRRPSDPELAEMHDLLHCEVHARMGCDKNTLGALLRLLSANALGIENQRDLTTILDAQQDDGGWETAWLWRFGKESIKIGSRGVPTAMAVKGIQGFKFSR